MSIRPSKNLRSAYKKCDGYFSKYIRLKYADKNGFCKCVTCNRDPLYWKEMDAGHFVGRNNKNTRYDEENVFPQCPDCNRFKDRRANFALYLLKKLGKKKFEALVLRGNQVRKWTIWEVDELSQYYSDKIKEIKNVKVLH